MKHHREKNSCDAPHDGDAIATAMANDEPDIVNVLLDRIDASADSFGAKVVFTRDEVRDLIDYLKALRTERRLLTARVGDLTVVPAPAPAAPLASDDLDGAMGLLGRALGERGAALVVSDCEPAKIQRADGQTFTLSRMVATTPQGLLSSIGTTRPLDLVGQVAFAAHGYVSRTLNGLLQDERTRMAELAALRKKIAAAEAIDAHATASVHASIERSKSKQPAKAP